MRVLSMQPLEDSVQKLSISQEPSPVAARPVKLGQAPQIPLPVRLKNSARSEDTTKAKRSEWDEPAEGAAPAGDWKMEVFEWGRKSEKRRQALDPDFQIEDPDPRREKSLFASSHNSGIRFEEMGKVPVTTQGSNIPPPWETVSYQRVCISAWLTH